MYSCSIRVKVKSKRYRYSYVNADWVAARLKSKAHRTRWHHFILLRIMEAAGCKYRLSRGKIEIHKRSIGLTASILLLFVFILLSRSLWRHVEHFSLRIGCRQTFWSRFLTLSIVLTWTDGNPSLGVFCPSWRTTTQKDYQLKAKKLEEFFYNTMYRGAVFPFLKAKKL